jgi:hypothetical protein
MAFIRGIIHLMGSQPTDMNNKLQQFKSLQWFQKLIVKLGIVILGNVILGMDGKFAELTKPGAPVPLYE